MHGALFADPALARIAVDVDAKLKQQLGGESMHVATFFGVSDLCLGGFDLLSIACSTGVMAEHLMAISGNLDFSSVIQGREGVVAAGISAGDHCLIDLNRVTFALPCGMAALAALVLRMREFRFRVSLSAEASRAFSYMQNMNLFKDMGIYTDEAFNRHEQLERFCRMARVDFTVDTEKLSREMLAVVQAESETKADLLNCLSESLSNLWAHARTAGFALAQSFQRRTESERYHLAIADCGVGIGASLRRAYPVRNDEHALDLACQRGVTCYLEEPDRGHFGMGLFHIDEIVKASNGRFILCSGTCKRVRQGDHVAYHSIPAWQGTILSIELSRNGITSSKPLTHNRTLRHA